MASESLSASQRAQIRRLSGDKPAAPGDEPGDLNVVPYLDIVTNILVFVLATISIVFVTNVEASNVPKGTGTRPVTDTKALDLVVMVVRDGVALTTSFGHVAPGCDSAEPHAGPGITVPRAASGAYDWRAVQRCVRALKESGPYGKETDVTLAANPDVAFVDIAHAIAALDHDDDGPLLPEVHFGAPR